MSHPCPDCDEPLVFAFRDTSGVGAHKRGDAYNTVPDTDHFVCFPCLKAWKQRLSGPLTPDVVGDLAFFSCRADGCGVRLELPADSSVTTEIELVCPKGHRYRVRPSEDGGITIAAA